MLLWESGWTYGRQRLTWPAQLPVLLLLSSIHLHAPSVEGKGKEVLQARGRVHYGVEAFEPLLTLLKGGELTPGDQKTNTRSTRLKV